MATELTENGKIIAKQREFVNSGATRPYEFRLQQLKRLKALLTNENDRLCEAMFKDTGRRVELTEFYECGLNFMEVDYFIDNLKDWMKPEYAQKTLITMLDTPFIQREPHGVVLLVSPFNYPISLTFVPLIPMLAAGNAVIFKPSELTPTLAALYEELFHRYFDERVVRVVQGDGPATAALLQERFDFICYTGSTRVGKLVMKAAAEHLTPVLLELGGQSPVFIDETADLPIAAKRIIWGRVSNGGQTCLAPNHVFLTQAVKEKLVPLLKKTILEFYGEEPQKSADMMRIINTRHFDRIKDYLDRSNGKILGQFGKLDRDDCYVPPMIVQVEMGDALLEEELFAPILPLVVVKHIDDAFELAKQFEKPLGAYIFSKDKRRVKRFVEELPAGNVGVNDNMLNYIVDTMPFGGVGYSGMGRYRGRSGFDTFSNLKNVLQRSYFADWLAACRYPPLTASKYRQMKAMVGKRIAFPKFLKVWLSRSSWILIGVAFSFLYNNYSYLLR